MDNFIIRGNIYNAATHHTENSSSKAWHTK